MNPEPQSYGLKLNISEHDNAMNLDLALSVAPYFRIQGKAVAELIENMKSIVMQWPNIATSLGISPKEQEKMAPAFRMSSKN